MKLGVVILAAGQGTRMKSGIPKVLHRLAGKPLLQHVIDTAKELNPAQIIVVYGHGGEAVKEQISADNLYWVEQQQQMGTGHAVQQTIAYLKKLDQILILYGDVPLTSSDTLKSLKDRGSELTLLTAFLDNPTGYGRIVRDEAEKIRAIVEHKDASEEQKKISEINTGIMAVRSVNLVEWLGRLENNNSQQEFYLTDIVGFAVEDGVSVSATHPAGIDEIKGINDRVQLAELERSYQRQQAEAFMRQGVTLADPQRFDVRGRVVFGKDCSVDVNVIFEGSVKIGNNVSIGANTVIKNCEIGDNVTIQENCVFEQAYIGNDSSVGPFARLRPGAQLQSQAHIGNFVEVKKSVIAHGSKVNHLSYIGDSIIGENVNIGAGTITCNYDGANKHQTIIGDNVFVGSNSALVAPVTLQQGTTVGAGSVITKDTEENSLSLTRAKQISINNWKRPVKKKR